MVERSYVLRIEMQGGQVVVKGLDDIGDKAERVGDQIRKGMEKEATVGARVFAAATAEGGRAIDDYAGRIGPLGSVLKAIGPAGLIAAAGIGAIGAAALAAFGQVTAIVDQLDELGDVADKMKVNAEAVQALRLSARDSGYEFSDADAAIAKVRDMRAAVIAGLSGSEKAATMFGALGISRDELEGLETAEALLNRIAVAVKAVGGEGRAMSILVKGGFESIAQALVDTDGNLDVITAHYKSAGLIFDKELVARAGELKGRWETLETQIGVSLGDAFVSMGEKAFPVMDTMLSKLKDVLAGLRLIDQPELQGLQTKARALGAHASAAEEDTFGVRIITPFDASGLAPGVYTAETLRKKWVEAVEAVEDYREAAEREAKAPKGPGIATQDQNGNWSFELPSSDAPAPRTSRYTKDVVDAATTAATEGAAAARKAEADGLRDVAAATQLVLQVQGREAQIKAQLAKTIDGLNEARRLGVIATDEERDALIRKAEAEAAAAFVKIPGSFAAGAVKDFDKGADSAHRMAEGLSEINLQAEAAQGGLNAFGDVIRGRITDLNGLLSAALDVIASLVEMAGMASLQGRGSLLGNLGTLITGGGGGSLGTFGSGAAGGAGGAGSVGGGSFFGGSGLGFKRGGYTGDGPEDEEAGPAHRREYYFDAPNTSRIGVPALEGLRRGTHDVVPRGLRLPMGGAMPHMTFSPIIQVSSPALAARSVERLAANEWRGSDLPPSFTLINNGQPAQAEVSSSRGADGRLNMKATLKPLVTGMVKEGLSEGSYARTLGATNGLRPALKPRG